MSPVDRGRRGRLTQIIATVAVATVAVGGAALGPGILGGSTGQTANVWLDPNNGAATCSRSATPTSYSAALTGGNVCLDLNDAGAAATAGDTIVARSGSYRVDYPSTNSYAMQVSADFSDGLGADVNPNAAEQGVSTGTTANWVTLTGETACTERSVIFGSISSAGGYIVFRGNNHLIVNGGTNKCIYLRAPQFGEAGNDSTLRSQNVQILNSDLDGYNIRGAKNILIKDSNVGPSLACAGGTDTVPAENYRCSATGPYFEAPWRSKFGGRGSVEGFNAKIGRNVGGYASINIRLEGLYLHDHQTRNANDAALPTWHDEGMIIQDNNGTNPNGDNSVASHNIVIDRAKFERNAVMEIFIDSSGGITLQNSTMGVPMEWLPVRDSDNWGTEAPNQYSLAVKATATPLTNVLIRYNAIRNGINNANTSNSNVRFIGNIIGRGIGSGACGFTGTTWDRNVYYASATCGTNNLSLGSNHPFIDIDVGTTWSNTLQADYHLTPGTKSFENWITESSSDYALTTDMDGAARTPGSRDAGPDER